MKEITIIVDKAGKTTIETSGFTGTACLDATARLKRALGGKVESEVMTNEAYVTAEVGTRVKG